MKSILKATLITFLTLLAIWILAHAVSQTASYEKRQFPKKLAAVSIFASSRSSDANTIPYLQKMANLGPDVGLEIDVQWTADKKLVLFPDQELDKKTSLQGHLWQTEWSKVQTAKLHSGESIPLLVDVLRKFPQHVFLLNLQERFREMAMAVYQTLKDENALDRVIIGGIFPQPLNDLRRLDAPIFTSAAPDEFLRLRTAVDLNLTGLDSMTSDFYFLPTKYERIPVLNAAVVSELKSRGKKIFVTDAVDLATAEKLKSLGVDGFLTNQPEFFKATSKKP